MWSCWVKGIWNPALEWVGRWVGIAIGPSWVKGIWNPALEWVSRWVGITNGQNGPIMGTNRRWLTHNSESTLLIDLVTHFWIYKMSHKFKNESCISHKKRNIYNYWMRMFLTATLTIHTCPNCLTMISPTRKYYP